MFLRRNEPFLWKRHVSPMALLALVVLLAYPYWFGTTNPGLDDLNHLNIPQRILLAWFYRHGHLPLWNPFNFAGQPFLAAGQSGPLYLPNLVFVMASVVWAVKLSYVFHELLAAWGMYAFVFQLQRSRLGAVVAASAFLCSGFLVGHQIHTQMFDAFAWLPILFWLVLRVWERVSVGRMLWLGIALSMEVYAGHPQVTFFVVLSIGMYVLLEFLQTFGRRSLVRFGAVWGAGLMALALSAPQWLPTLQYVTYSTRTEATPAFLLNLSFPPQALAQFLSPFLAGGGYSGQPFSSASFQAFVGSPLYWEFTCYIGIIVFATAAAVVARFARVLQPVRNLFVMALVSLTLALGSFSPVSRILVQTPGFDLFRVPARYIGLVDFSVCALAGIGFSLLLAEDGWKALRLPLGTAALILTPVLPMLKLQGLLHHPVSWITILVPCSLLLFTAGICIWPNQRTFRWRVTSLVIVAMLDSVSSAGLFSGFIFSVPGQNAQASAVTQFLQNHLDSPYPFVRIASLDDTNLAFDESAASQIPSVNGYDSLEPTWYADNIALTWTNYVLLSQPRTFLDRLGVQYILTSTPSHAYLPTHATGHQSWTHWVPVLPPGLLFVSVNMGSTVADTVAGQPLFSVTLHSGSHALTRLITAWPTRHFVIPLPTDWPHNQATQVTLDNENWSTSYSIQSLTFTDSVHRPVTLGVHQAMGPLAWKLAFHTSQVFVWKNPDPLRSAWLAPNVNSPEIAGSNPIKLVEWYPNSETWRVPPANPGVLVVSQMYDPNWRAFINGRSAPVIRVDGVLTGIVLPKGTREVRLVFDPSGFRAGVTMALLACVIAATGVYMTYRRNRRRHPR